MKLYTRNNGASIQNRLTRLEKYTTLRKRDKRLCAYNLLCRFCHMLAASIKPALAMLFASTDDTSKKPWELTGFSPSEASIEESASKYTLCGQSNRDKKC